MVRTSESQLVITALVSSIKQDLAVVAVDMLPENTSLEDGWDSELQHTSTPSYLISLVCATSRAG
ncbi:hypothetical protein PGT21_035832 [Puccinia graminis f. sp. tritici]|uniref:Uncharacterized protein n=1 Tax=Puccinia graminis f. sp. tritici TaxID=56615 RepID=A0A5B0R306_PUCGR|nr:hypothetical protein PGT21_035832 [Puccinia graminis f. sp. tritici]